MDEEEREKEERGFVVRDKRHFSQQEGKQPRGEEEAQEKPKADEARLREEGPGKEAEEKEETKEETKEEQRGQVPLPEVTFSNFVFSLTTQALIQLGEIQDPESKESLKNLPFAKQTIDLISMLREKTTGNLTKEEETLVDNALYDLRMRYVKAVR